jgi:hypothetical protein
MNGERKGTSPWVYAGVGCGALLVLGVVALAAIGYGAFRWGKQVEKDIKDPATRTAKVKAVLGADTLPDGYHPMVGLSIPLLMDMAMLSDREPGADGQVHGPMQRGFIYVRVLSAGSNEKDLRDYFEARRTTTPCCAATRSTSTSATARSSGGVWSRRTAIPSCTWPSEGTCR